MYLLKTFRTHMGFTQAQVAKAIGKSTSYYARLEKATCCYEGKVIEDLAFLFEVPFTLLFIYMLGYSLNDRYEKAFFMLAETILQEILAGRK